MDRRISIKKHFTQKQFINELGKDRNHKRYGMYAYNIKSKDNFSWNVHSTGNNFFELLASFAGVENLNQDKYDILDKIILSVNEYIKWSDFHSQSFHYLSNIDDPFELDFEKWSKLMIRDLYNYDIVSPFRYYKFTWDQGVGVSPFYFRGQTDTKALKSFSFNHKRTTSHNKNKINYDNFIEDFYKFSTRFLGLNADPDGINGNNMYHYNIDRFLRESGFFERTTPKKAFEENSYYKRRELIV